MEFGDLLFDDMRGKPCVFLYEECKPVTSLIARELGATHICTVYVLRDDEVRQASCFVRPGQGPLDGIAELRFVQGIEEANP